jgi:hypothetical protein
MIGNGNDPVTGVTDNTIGVDSVTLTGGSNNALTVGIYPGRAKASI